MPSRILHTLYAVTLLATSCHTQTSTTPPAPGSPDDLVQRGEKLSHDGKQDEALALYTQALDKSPDFYLAHLDSGIALDLKGDYAAAREHLTKAIEVAPDKSKQQALRAMAFSYAFQGDADQAAKVETQV